MRLLVASVVCVLLALNFPGIVSKLEDNITECGDFFFQAQSPVLPGILENSVTQDNRYKIICQKYKNKIRFATLYDTTNRIPVFSAYKYTGTDESVRPEIPRIWMTELQLEQHSDAEMHYPFLYQARNEDYWIKDKGTKNECTHGTLFSMKHIADLETAESTFTLTNTVPEIVGFRERTLTLANAFKDFMHHNCLDNNNKIAAYVLTGAIPSKATWNKRVNIPSFMWTVFCCYNSSTNSMISQTYRDENKKDSNNTVTIKDLKSLEDFLQKYMPNGVRPMLFNNNCE
ncbi:endonuclease domain-containing 1 protein-like [Triplophysa rosa]|uniref:endonuclease domain-containing 1 protein-like n=1 Tax=Triplophysa rosa TaxID=992332 RepID=UPI002545F485|nr:endonuclease domain-containing 1 protein-like [Triplophysa rosa]